MGRQIWFFATEMIHHPKVFCTCDFVTREFIKIFAKNGFPQNKASPVSFLLEVEEFGAGWGVGWLNFKTESQTNFYTF